MRPEFQLLIAMYAIHFAVWVPMAVKLATRESLPLILLVLAPLAVCYGMPAIWLSVSCAFRKNSPQSQEGPGLLRIVHVCLIAFTVLCLLIRVSGSLFVT